MTYDAKSIRILREDEIKQFDWHWAEELAHEHVLPLDWVKRGFEASRWSPEATTCHFLLVRV
ncbi:hypothetical protein [Arsenophonus sp.]|uniref:hypothetical protein n=1 Tax=Arsenophonus sp. TaxID=1872640 RepID=UPI003879926C